ncbi:fructokinase [Azospirillum fermentarium]|uniref:ROK family protein n=1 Tax=Azospirillum fermentarium TaxID=1233114 RepID=UPI002226A4F4|nr:ROK family protein [Azospirillum fermentarium]MCW2247509.1 fructokinase [Azospirillum fermentarium]
MNRIGIDLGGTKIEGIVLDADGNQRARRRVPTPRGDYAGTVQAIAALVAGLEQETGGGRASVGLGIPGIVSPRTGLVKNANSTWLIGRPFDRDLSAALGRPVRVENDANCLAVSEAADGAAAGAAVVFAAIVGTGVGGGIVVHGRPLTGRNAIAGEWGHSPLPWPDIGELPGPSCYCGKAGCLETFASGPGVAADHARVTGETLTAADIAARAAAGDGAARATMDRLAGRLGRGLATVVNLLDPDVIVLGGGLSNIPYLYEALPAVVERHAFSDTIDTPIRPARHGDSSGVRGAAWLWRPEEPA